MDKIRYQTGSLVSLEFLLNLSETLDDFNFGQVLEFLIDQYGILWDNCNSIGSSLAVTSYKSIDGTSDFTELPISGGIGEENRWLILHSGWAITQKLIEIKDETDQVCEQRLVPVMIHVPEDETIITSILPNQPKLWSLTIEYNEEETCPYVSRLCADTNAIRLKKSYTVSLVPGTVYNDPVPGRLVLARILFGDTTTEEGYCIIDAIEDLRYDIPKLIFKQSFLCNPLLDSTEYDFVNKAHIFHYNTSISCCAFAGLKNQLLDSRASGIDIPLMEEYALMSDKGAVPKDGFVLLEPTGPFNGSAAFFDYNLKNFIKNTAFTWSYHCQFIEEVITRSVTVGGSYLKYLGYVDPVYHNYLTAFPGWYKRVYPNPYIPLTWNTLTTYQCHWWTFYGLDYDITDYNNPSPHFSTFGTTRDSYINPYGTKWIIVPPRTGIISGKTWIVGRPQGKLMLVNESDPYDMTSAVVDLYPVPWVFDDDTRDCLSKVYWDNGFQEGQDWRVARALTGSYDSIHLFNTFSDKALDKLNTPNPNYRYKQLAKYITVWAYVNGVDGQGVYIRLHRVQHPINQYGCDNPYPEGVHEYEAVAYKALQLTKNGPQIIYATFKTTGTGPDSLGLNPNSSDTTTDIRFAVELINLHSSYDLKVMTIQVVPGVGDAPFMPHFGFMPEWAAPVDNIIKTIQAYNPNGHLQNVPLNIEAPWPDGSWYNAISYWDVFSRLGFRVSNTYLWYDLQRNLGIGSTKQFTVSGWMRLRPIIEFYPTAGGNGQDYFPTSSDRFLIFNLLRVNKYEEEICDTTEVITIYESISLFRRVNDPTTGKYELVLRFDNGSQAEELVVLLPQDVDSDWYRSFHLITASWDLEKGIAMLMIDDNYYTRLLNGSYSERYEYISIGGWNPKITHPNILNLHSGQFWLDELLIVDEFVNETKHSYYYGDKINPFTRYSPKLALTAFGLPQISKQIVSNPIIWQLVAMNAAHDWNYFVYRGKAWNSSSISDFARYNMFSISPIADIDCAPVIGFAHKWMMDNIEIFYPYQLGYKTIEYNGIDCNGTDCTDIAVPIKWRQLRKNITTGFCNPGLFELDRVTIPANTVDIEYNIFFNIHTIFSYFTGRHITDFSGRFPNGSDNNDTDYRAYNNWAEYYVPKRLLYYDSSVYYLWPNLISNLNRYCPHNLNIVTFGTLIPYIIDATYYDHTSFEDGHPEPKMPHQYGEAIFGAAILHTIYRYKLNNQYFDTTENAFATLAEPSRTNTQNIIRDAILIPFRTSLMATSNLASGSIVPYLGTVYNPDTTDIHSSGLAQNIPTPLFGSATLHNAYYIYYGPQYGIGLIEHITQNNLIINIWDLTPTFCTQIYTNEAHTHGYGEISHARFNANIIKPVSTNSPENMGWDFDVYKAFSIQIMGIAESFAYHRWKPGSFKVLEIPKQEEIIE